jgi:phosphatidate cytidylyltransferase
MVARVVLLVLVALAGIASILRIVFVLKGKDILGRSYVYYMFFLLLSIVFAEFDLFKLSLLTLVFISFFALREYFSLIDIRPQDRIAIWAAFLLIPFQYYFVFAEWYGMFIIAVPVYGFLVIPLFIAMGGRESKGTVFSIGAIDFGLFLYVFCLGHIGYLLLMSIWQPVLLILIVVVSDVASFVLRRGRRVTFGTMILIYLIPLPLTIWLAYAMMPWTGIPLHHSIILACMIPALTMMGRLTGRYIKHDLVGEEEPFIQSQGQVLDNLRSFLYAAPVTFHYIRYFLS